jgi:hypothetical protein
MFEKMGEDPEDPEYILPNDDDVWNFINSIGNWLNNTGRKGIPV